jgi:hypothetical protein
MRTLVSCDSIISCVRATGLNHAKELCPVNNASIRVNNDPVVGKKLSDGLGIIFYIRLRESLFRRVTREGNANNMMKTRACFSGLQFLQRIVCTNGFFAQHS